MPKKEFNVEPYFDDFNSEKGFHKVLFKPRSSVQTRELNQLQSITSNQIEKFGNHIFKHGSMVANTTLDYNNDVQYVRLKDLDYNNENINVDKISGRKLHGRTSQIFATTITESIKTDIDPATIYVNYINSGVNDEKTFLDGETVDALDDNDNIVYTFIVKCPNCPDHPVNETINPTGRASIFSITDGTYYIFGYFVYVEQQSIILSKYSYKPYYDVGLNIEQNIITANDDISLLDNALGYPNYKAEGSDRYQIKLKLAKRNYNSADSDNWVLLARISYGILNEIRDKPQYSDVQDMIARRTYDESGNYTIKPFTLSFKQLLKSDKNSNDGLVYPDSTTDHATLEYWKNHFMAVFQSGKAYVKGYEIEKIAESYINVEKARDTTTINSSAVRVKQGNYILVKLGDDGTNVTSNVLSLTDVESSNEYAADFEKIDLHDNIIVNGVSTGSIIGYARVKSQEIYPTTLAETIYKLYLFDIEFISNISTFADVKGIMKNGNNPFYCNMIADDEIYVGSGISNARIYEPNSNNLLIELPYKYTKNITDTTMTVRKKYIGVSSATGEFIFGVNGVEYLTSFNQNTWICGQQDISNGEYLPYELLSSNTTFLNTQSAKVTGLQPNKNVVIVCDVLITNVTAKQKILDNLINTYNLTIVNQYNTIELSKTDCVKIVKVMDTTNNIDITKDFTLDKNIQDNYYGKSSIKRLSGSTPLTADIDIEYTIEYFDHVGNNNGYFFNVNSYDTLITDPNNNFDYDDIPTYLAKNGTTYDLKSSLDFRPDIDDEGNNGNEFNITSFIPSKDSNIIFDIEFYLPRKDKLVLAEDGTFQNIKGVPDIEPKLPITPKNMMTLYEISLGAYTFDLENDITVKYVDNRRFTMKDISKIEHRVDNLENIITLTQLEENTINLSIKDINGLDRYKNGLITDNFSNFNASETNHQEFNATLDTNNKELRPSYIPKYVSLLINETNSSNFKRHGDIITQSYDEKLYINQPFASKSLSVNPYFIFNWQGQLELIPSLDNWKDIETKPTLVIGDGSGFKELINSQNDITISTPENLQNNQSDIDFSPPFVNKNKTINNEFNSWRNNKSNVISSTVNNTTTNINSGGVNVVNTSITNTRTANNLGLRVTDVNIIPYIRSKSVQIVATNLRPNTKVYPFFDDVLVSEYCRPLNGVMSDDLITNEEGDLVAIFTIPNNDLIKFNIGDRVFKLTDNIKNDDNVDETTTTAKNTYWASGIKQVKQSTILIDEVIKTNTNTRFIANPPIPSPPPQVIYTPSPPAKPLPQPPLVKPVRQSVYIEPDFSPPMNISRPRGKRRDPVAQEFVIIEENGVMLTSCGIFFKSKSKNKSVWFEIREMENGYPSSKIVKYSQCIKKGNNVNISEDGTLETIFKFEAPIYLNPIISYCIVIGSDDPDYRIFVSRLGENNLIDNTMITTQPTLGSLFKSQNNETWNAEQLEDVKFNLYKADFNRDDMVLEFNNIDFDSQKLRNNPFECEAGSNLIRVHHKSHGLVNGDKVKLNVLTGLEYEVIIQSGDIIIGQTLTGSINNGSLVVTSAKFIENVTVGVNTYKKYIITFNNLTKDFQPLENFTSNSYNENIDNTSISQRLDINQGNIENNIQLLSNCVGYFENGITTILNGIDLSRFTEVEHIMQAVDHMDSYVIQLSGVNNLATVKGFTGGNNVYAKGNIQVDNFELNGDIILHDCTINWNTEALKHSGINSKFNGQDYNIINDIKFIENTMVELEQPLKIANRTNEDSNNSGNPSIIFTATSRTINNDNNISPVIDLSSLGLITITNRVDNVDENVANIEPNQTTDIQPLNNDITSPNYNGRFALETYKNGGMNVSKYILKKVTLQNPATSMRIIMDINKSIDNTIDVYYKVLSADSSDTLENMEWIKTDFDNDITSEHNNDFKEVTISVGDDSLLQTPLADFKEFRIKILLRSNNSAKVPKVKNFRCVATT